MVTYLSGNRIQGSSAPLGNISKANLKLYYTMDEASGDLVNTASAIGSTHALSNFNLSVSGATQNVTGKLNKCVSFSGNNYADADDSSLSDTAFLSNNGAAWTVCVWLKVEGLGSGGNIIGDQALFSTSDFQSGENGVFCRIAGTVAPPNNPAYTSLLLGTNGDDKAASNSTANGLTAASSPTGWHFHTIQYDDSTGIGRTSLDNGAWNNIFTGANLTNTDTPSNKFRIGNNPPLDNDLNGDMDEFSLWDRILTAAEITAIYNSGTGEVLSTVQTTGADEKVAILANAPTGTRYEEINTRKIFRKIA